MQDAVKQYVGAVVVEPDQITRGAEEAITRLVMDGVEFRATEEIISEWLYKRGYITTARPKDGNYGAQRSNGLRLVGQDKWPTYHEMLRDLLARIDDEECGA